MKHQVPLFLVLIFCAVWPAPAAENWPQFRGPGCLGVSQSADLPDTWSDSKNVLWKQDVPGRGWSSPVVWGNRIFLTTVVNRGEYEKPKKGLYYGGNRSKPPQTVHLWKLLCLDLDSGKLLWEKLAHEGLPPYSMHIKNSYASETPVTDGRHVWAYFGNVGLFCYDFEGKLAWSKSLTPHKTRYDWGTAASPALHEDRLYIVNDNEERSYLTALDKLTGRQIWRVERDEKSNWSTPYVWQNELRTEIITPGTGKTRAYDLKGKLLYEFGGFSVITIATPYSKFGLLYVGSGFIMDPRRPLMAIRQGASGDISLTEGQTSSRHVAWCQPTASPYNPSTLVYGELVYSLLDRGFLACYDARSGEEIYGRQRIPNGRAFTSSPWAYGGKVFCLNEDGVTFVVRAGRSFEILHTNRLAEDDMCMATPAMVGDKLLIRTAARIYCIAP